MSGGVRGVVLTDALMLLAGARRSTTEAPTCARSNHGDEEVDVYKDLRCFGAGGALERCDGGWNEWLPQESKRRHCNNMLAVFLRKGG